MRIGVAIAVVFFPSLVCADKQYNVLYLLADDLRPEIAAGYGQTQMITPNIDKLASSGIVFSKAYCQQAVCGPSRNSFMTGRRPHRTNVMGTGSGEDFRKSGQDNNGPGSDWITMPQHFKQHNFTTLGGGKTFHPNHPKNFDYPKSWSTDMPYFDFDYWLKQEVTGADYSGPCPGFSKPSDSSGLAGPIAVWCALEEPDEHFYDQGLATDTIKRLRYAAELYKDEGKPFFIQSGFARPHTPWRVPQRFWDLYKTQDIQLAQHKLPPSGMPGIAWMAHSFFNASSGETWPLNVTQPLPDPVAQLARHAYYASVSWLDHQIGRILDELHTLGLEKETIVLFHGDHGWQLGEHNSWHKYTNFEVGTRTPLIIRAPMHVQSVGQVAAGLAELVDIYPTLAELAGTPKPSDIIDGVSLIPFLDEPSRITIPTTEDQGSLNKTVVFSQYPHSSGNSAVSECPFFRDGACSDKPLLESLASLQWMGFSVRDQRWRYTAWVPFNGTHADWTLTRDDGVFEELYDHASDPGTDFDAGDDTLNLAYDSARSGTVKEFFDIARNFFDVVVPPLPPPPPVVDDCKSWCEGNIAEWATKCTWTGCAACAACTQSHCKPWCAGSAKDWSMKCTWEGCSACDACASQPSRLSLLV